MLDPSLQLAQAVQFDLLPEEEGVLVAIPVRMDGFKLEEGELFKEDFRKLLK